LGWYHNLGKIYIMFKELSVAIRRRNFNTAIEKRQKIWNTSNSYSMKDEIMALEQLSLEAYMLAKTLKHMSVHWREGDE
jgi:hypothetical protein